MQFSDTEFCEIKVSLKNHYLHHYFKHKCMNNNKDVTAVHISNKQLLATTSVVQGEQSVRCACLCVRQQQQLCK